MKYVIVGNSCCRGGGVSRGIRQQDAENRIVVISDEPYHTYSRPAISYLLYGKTTEEDEIPPGRL